MKSFDFAVKIVNQDRSLWARMKDHTLPRQLLKSGTSIGANVHEGLYAQSDPDFLTKMTIALKEASETEYWLELLRATNYLMAEEFEEMINDLDEILSLLIATTRTMKEKLQEEK